MSRLLTAIPSGASPRFDALTADPDEVERAIDMVGHCVLTNVFSLDYLKDLHQSAARSFQNEDKRYISEPHSLVESEIECHLGSFIGLDKIALYSIKNIVEINSKLDILNNSFYFELQRTPLIGLFYKLLRGNFVVFESERCFRRVDPQFPLRFTGLHADDQLSACYNSGYKSTRGFTIWVPLHDILDDTTSRLLIMHRDLNFSDIDSLFGEEYKIHINGHEFLPIEIKPKQIRNESKANSEAICTQIYGMFSKLYEAYGEHSFAPYLDRGSVVIFENNVWHGSLVQAGQTRPRYSLDFRVTGEYKLTEANKIYHGRMFGPESIF